MLQTVIYMFGCFCSESWENESRENFSSKRLEVSFANKMDEGGNSCIGRKSKDRRGMILQRRRNGTAAFLWALSRDPLVLRHASVFLKAPGEL